MNHLVYVVDQESPYGHPEDDLDLATAPGYQLFFSCFMGDIKFIVEEVDFRTYFGWVSTLSLALGMLRRVQELSDTSESMVEFQEDEEWIFFERKLDNVRISCSYTDGLAVISYPELQGLAQDALVSLLDKLYVKYPPLALNTSLKNALLEFGRVEGA